MGFDIIVSFTAEKQIINRVNIILFSTDETKLPICDKRVEHINKVLKLQPGDSFDAGIINGKKGRATVEKTENGFMYFSFDFNIETFLPKPLTLIIAQVRPICMKRILREVVSLGIEKLILTVSDLGEKSYLTSSLYNSDEYVEIMKDGAMQSGETNLPECIIVPSLDKAITYSSGKKILLDNVIGKVELSDMNLKGTSVTLAIGPERGWSDRERNLLLENDFSPALLGRRILRTETAAVASTFLVLSKI